MVVFGNGALRAQYYILTLQRMFKSTSSGYRVDKLGYVSCIRPLKIFCRSLGHIGPVVLDKTLKYRKIIMQICLPIGKKHPASGPREKTQRGEGPLSAKKGPLVLLPYLGVCELVRLFV